MHSPTYKPPSFHLAAFVICFVTALAFGVTFGDSSSNHPTYLPPGIQLVDNGFLAFDWWLTNAVHYHWAFNFLVAFLHKMHILALGLVVLNISAITLSLFFCYLIMKEFNPRLGIEYLLVLCSLFLLTKSFSSVATTYLFTTSLQASSLATLGTIAAFYHFTKNNLFKSGIWLAFAGIFHTNFLIVNIALFGLAYLLSTMLNRPALYLWVKNAFIDLTKLLGLSLVAVGINLPLLLKISSAPLAPEPAKLAHFIFFNFAVPHHYLPNTYLIEFLPLAGWAIIGICFLALAIKRSRATFLLGCLLVASTFLIAVATFFTTVVFLDVVSRLFLWRLAPFLVLTSVLLMLAGLSNINNNDLNRPLIVRVIALAFFGLGLALVIRVILYHNAIWHTRSLLEWVIYLSVYLCFALPWLFPKVTFYTGGSTPGKLIRYATAPLFILCIFAAFEPSRFSYLYLTDEEKSKTELYTFAKEHTPVDSQFLIPPDLNSFRLLAARAIVVDFKALPFEQTALLEWYTRLATISRTTKPASQQKVNDGYLTLAARDLDFLKEKYGITHAVFTKEHKIEASPHWQLVFENPGFKVFQSITP